MSLDSMGLVCSGQDGLAGVPKEAVLQLQVDAFIAEAIALRAGSFPISEDIESCFKEINAGVLQLGLFEFVDDKYWQPTALFRQLVSCGSYDRRNSWRAFLNDVENAVKLAQCKLSVSKLDVKDVKLQKFSFCLLVSQSQTGCAQQVLLLRFYFQTYCLRSCFC
jgi:hypothetical protein